MSHLLLFFGIKANNAVTYGDDDCGDDVVELGVQGSDAMVLSAKI